MKSKLYLLPIVLLLLGACTSVKNIAYMQDIDKQMETIAAEIGRAHV